MAATPIELAIDRDRLPGNTSFDLSKCNIVRSGNVLLK